MMVEQIWLLKVLLSHLLTDFVLQPRSWINDRKNRHFASLKLYLHGIVTAISALLFTGIEYWPVALIILVTHILIDGWKSYQREAIIYFVLDQVLHLLVIAACWYFLFADNNELLNTFNAAG